MALSSVFEKFGRAIFESPFGVNQLASEAPELAEIRLAALDAIKAKSHRVGAANVFAFDVVRIRLLGVPEAQEPVFRSEFLLNYFAEELKSGLVRSSYRFPKELRVEFETTARLPEVGESWIAVETDVSKPETSAESVETFAPAVLTVVAGAANQAELALEKLRTNIGRTAEVFRKAGPSRRNDLAFVGDDEVNRTVSREHAHIVRDSKTNEYRMFNDRVYRGDGNCGLWIVRDGLSYPVHRSARGTVLLDGDEIHIGSAVVRFGGK